MTAHAHILTPAERAAHMAALHAHGLRETLGTNVAPHAPTVGLLAYAHDDARRAAWLAIRDDVARVARGRR